MENRIVSVDLCMTIVNNIYDSIMGVVEEVMQTMQEMQEQLIKPDKKTDSPSR